MEQTHTQPHKSSWLSGGLQNAATGVISTYLPIVGKECIKVTFISLSLISVIAPIALQFESNSRPFWKRLALSFITSSVTNLAATSAKYLWDSFFPSTPKPFVVDEERNEYWPSALQEDEYGKFVIFCGKRVPVRTTHIHEFQPGRFITSKERDDNAPVSFGFGAQLTHTVFKMWV